MLQTTITKICAKLKEKHALFLKYEHATEQMTTCLVDDLEDLVEQRQQLADQIDAISGTITSLMQEENEPDLLQEALLGHPANGAQTMQEVVELSQDIYASANRIRRMEPQVVERMELERESLLLKIKENNHSMHARASKFFNTTSGQMATGGFGKFGNA